MIKFPHIREPSQISPPSNTDKIYTPQNLPNTLFEEWPNETETDMNEYLSPLSDTEIFKDHNPEKIYLPKNLYEDYLMGEIKWNRPEFYVKENNLNISIKKIPKKSFTQNPKFTHRQINRRIRKRTHKKKLKKIINNEKQKLSIKRKHTKFIKHYTNNFKIQRNERRIAQKIKRTIKQRVYTGLLYSIVELFNNKEFNMNRLLPIDFSNLRELMKNFNTTNVFKQLSRAEKREYIKKLKDIKTIQKEEKTKRIENLKVKGKKIFQHQSRKSFRRRTYFHYKSHRRRNSNDQKMFNEQLELSPNSLFKRSLLSNARKRPFKSS